MNGLIVGIVIAVAFAAFVYYLIRKRQNPFWYRNAIDRALVLLGTTPKRTASAELFYEKDAPAISEAAVDGGIQDVWARVICRYPARWENHHFKVVVLKGELSPESHTPCFRVAINDQNTYWNTEWDMMRGSKEKVHYVLAAGQMGMVGEPYGDVIIIPSSADETFIRTITDYEFEHCLLGWYNGDEYDRTKYHDASTPHPIIPPCPEGLRADFSAVVASPNRPDAVGKMMLVK